MYSDVDKNQQPSKVLGPTLPPSQSKKPLVSDLFHLLTIVIINSFSLQTVFHRSVRLFFTV